MLNANTLDSAKATTRSSAAAANPTVGKSTNSSQEEWKKTKVIAWTPPGTQRSGAEEKMQGIYTTQWTLAYGSCTAVQPNLHSRCYQG